MVTVIIAQYILVGILLKDSFFEPSTIYIIEPATVTKVSMKNRKTKIDDLGKCHNESRQFDSSIAGTLYLNPFFLIKIPVLVLCCLLARDARVVLCWLHCTRSGCTHRHMT